CVRVRAAYYYSSTYYPHYGLDSW
nr:immunoglobulin heavy chain junction region [Macaca mulatta]